MFKNILRTSTILKNGLVLHRQNAQFTTSSLFNSVGNGETINYSNLIKQYKFNLDGTLKTNTSTLMNNNNMKSIYLLKDLNLSQDNNNNEIISSNNTTTPKETLEMSSVIIKRRKMMSKHKQKKLRKRTRALKKRLGKI